MNGAFPVATSIRPVSGSITAPARPQIAESLAGHDFGGSISPWRFEHSEFHTAVIRPLARLIVTTWPWYGGMSPM